MGGIGFRFRVSETEWRVMREEPVRYKVSEFRFQPVNASDI
jgi:hypothetical protein